MLRLELLTTMAGSVMTDIVFILRACTDGIAVTCGMISQSNISDPDKKYGVKNLGNVVSKRLKIQGFIVFDPDFGVRIVSVQLLPNPRMILRLET